MAYISPYQVQYSESFEDENILDRISYNYHQKLPNCVTDEHPDLKGQDMRNFEDDIHDEEKRYEALALFINSSEEITESFWEYWRDMTDRDPSEVDSYYHNALCYKQKCSGCNLCDSNHIKPTNIIITKPVNPVNPIFKKYIIS